MIRKYRYGTPFDTEALTEKIETTEGIFPYGEISQEEYDNWRYNYPELNTSEIRAKVPSLELSDELIKALKKENQ